MAGGEKRESVEVDEGREIGDSFDEGVVNAEILALRERRDRAHKSLGNALAQSFRRTIWRGLSRGAIDWRTSVSAATSSGVKGQRPELMVGCAMMWRWMIEGTREKRWKKGMDPGVSRGILRV